MLSDVEPACFRLLSAVAGNTELAAPTGVDPEWILRATGIEERRYAAPEQTVTDLAVLAAKDCLESGGIEVLEIGMIIVASGSAARRFPGPAASVGCALGLAGVPAIDLPMASAGSLFGIALAARMPPHATCWLSARRSCHTWCRQILRAATPRSCSAMGPARAWSAPTQASLRSWIPNSRAMANWPTRFNCRSMDRIILHASRKLPRAICAVLERNHIAAGEVAAYLLHQANWNLITRVAHTLAVPEAKFYCNLARYGNTSSASLLIAAAEWRREDGSKPGDPVVLAAFGAGLHWGAVLARVMRDGCRG